MSTHDLIFWAPIGIGTIFLLWSWGFTLWQCPHHWPETLVVTVIISGLGLALYPVYKRGVTLREYHAKVKIIRAWNRAHPLSTPQPVPTKPE